MDTHDEGSRRRSRTRTGCLATVLTVGVAAVVTVALAAWALSRLDIGAADPVETSCEGTGARLHHAAFAGDLPRVRALLDAGTDPDERAPDTLFALECAVAGDSDEVVRALLDAGADPDEALWSAVHHRDATALVALLDAGADPDHVEPDGQSITALAVCTAPPSMAELLLERGAAAVGVGCALERGEWTLARSLLERGATASAWDVDAIVDLGDPTLVEAALDGGVDPSWVVLAAVCDPAPDATAEPCDGPARGTRLDAASAAIARGAAADPLAEPAIAASLAPVPEALRSQSTTSALTLAAGVGDAELVALLLDAGAPPDGNAELTLGPLEAARRGGHTEVSELLSAAGATP